MFKVLILWNTGLVEVRLMKISWWSKNKDSKSSTFLRVTKCVIVQVPVSALHMILGISSCSYQFIFGFPPNNNQDVQVHNDGLSAVPNGSLLYQLIINSCFLNIIIPDILSFLFAPRLSTSSLWDCSKISTYKLPRGKLLTSQRSNSQIYGSIQRRVWGRFQTSFNLTYIQDASWDRGW